MKGRDGLFYNVKAPLDDGTAEGRKKAGTDRVARLSTLYAQHNAIAPTLFKKGANGRTQFEETFENQKYHLENCLFESYIQIQDASGSLRMVHALEKEDGKFHMLRGTNRNESFHHSVNGIWPVHCTDGLGESLYKAHKFAWNFSRSNGMCRESFSGMDPSLIRISNLTSIGVLTKLSEGISEALENSVLQPHRNHKGTASSRSHINTTDKNSGGYDSMKHHYDFGSHKSSKSRKVRFTKPVIPTTVNIVDDAEEEIVFNSSSRDMTLDELNILLTAVEQSPVSSTGMRNWKEIQKRSGLMSYSTDILKFKFYNWSKLQHREKHTSHTMQAAVKQPLPDNLSKELMKSVESVTNVTITSLELQNCTSLCQSFPKKSICSQPLPKEPHQNAAVTRLYSPLEFPKSVNFSLNDIKAVELPKPPPRQPFNDVEKSLYQFLIENKPTAKWREFKAYWDYYAKFHSLKNNSVSLYDRTKDQLEQFYKDHYKKPSARDTPEHHIPEAKRMRVI